MTAKEIENWKRNNINRNDHLELCEAMDEIHLSVGHLYLRMRCLKSSLDHKEMTRKFINSYEQRMKQQNVHLGLTNGLTHQGERLCSNLLEVWQLSIVNGRCLFGCAVLDCHEVLTFELWAPPCLPMPLMEENAAGDLLYGPGLMSCIYFKDLTPSSLQIAIAMFEKLTTTKGEEQ